MCVCYFFIKRRKLLGQPNTSYLQNDRIAGWERFAGHVQKSAPFYLRSFLSQTEKKKKKKKKKKVGAGVLFSDSRSRLISVTWTVKRGHGGGFEVFIGTGGTRRRYKRRFVSGVSRRQITESAAGTPWNSQYSAAGLRHPGIVAASGRWKGWNCGRAVQTRSTRLPSIYSSLFPPGIVVPPNSIVSRHDRSCVERLRSLVLVGIGVALSSHAALWLG